MDNQRTYFGLTLDPLHIGTGGYRLGRVDNTIVRESGTSLPFVPGSSISGVCRNYSIYGLNDKEKKDAVKCTTSSTDKNNCGSCKICKTFGFAAGQAKESRIGLVKFFDASILAFPVSTMCGPVWVTSVSSLQKAGISVDELGPNELGPEELVVNFTVPDNRLDLGWLYLPCSLNENLSLDSGGNSMLVNNISGKLVVAPEYLFPEIVNSNLEVRTSVSINFETGAAEKGNLFTYEAIPRATLLCFDLVVDAYRCTSDFSENDVWSVVGSGLTLFKTMGMGGMNTRGFGRMAVENSTA